MVLTMTNDYVMFFGSVFLIIAFFCWLAVVLTAGSDHWLLGWLCWIPVVFVIYFLVRFPKASRDNLDRNPVYVLIGLPLSLLLAFACYSQSLSK